MPAYFRGALVTGEKLLGLSFALSFFFIARATLHWEWGPAVMLVIVALSAFNADQHGPRLSIGIFAAVILGWCAWYVYILGWGTGIQGLLVPLLVLIFFNIFTPPWVKIAFFLLLLGVRMLLYSYSLSHSAVYELDRGFSVLFQTANSAVMFFPMAIICIYLSSSIQDAERQLRLDNQALYREAGTDPLTQLPNRRALMDEIDAFMKERPSETFCVAIADIDFFKKVNDTYGHLCGDYTLKSLAERFRQTAGTGYKVCRWGGEEFCFFMPGMNIDDAGKVMMDLNVAVGRMPLNFEGTDFSITITAGVEEYDFHSAIDAIIEEADRKLYMGKESGRNRVVV